MSTQATRQTVLVVDDDEMSREVLCVLLDAEGFGAVSAASGDVALAMIEAGDVAPAIVLTDLQMPGLAGGRLAEALRAACGPAALLIAMSASRPAQADGAAFDGFLLKPFTMQDFGSLVSTLGERDGRDVVAAPDTSEVDRAAAVVLDEATYRQLRVAIPAKQMIELYGIFVKDSRERIEQMRRLVNEQDSVTFIREAHSIKGGASMLGAREIAHLALTLEKDGLAAEGLASSKREAGDVDAIHPDVRAVNPLDELKAAFLRLERILVSRDAP